MSSFLVYAIFEVEAEDENHAIKRTDDLLVSRLDAPTPEYAPEIFYVGIDLTSTVRLDPSVSYRDPTAFDLVDESEECYEG